MGKPIAVDSWAQELSAQTPSTLTYKVQPTIFAAAKTRASGKKLLISKIVLSCSCSGDYVTGTSTFVGAGQAAIEAQSPGLRCEGQPVLLEGDKVTITCDGTITTTASGATGPGKASVTVTIKSAGQQKTILG